MFDYLKAIILIGHIFIVAAYWTAAGTIWADNADALEMFGPDTLSREILSAYYGAFGTWGCILLILSTIKRNWKFYIASVASQFELSFIYNIYTLILTTSDSTSDVVILHIITLVVLALELFVIYYFKMVKFFWE